MEGCLLLIMGRRMQVMRGLALFTTIAVLFCGCSVARRPVANIQRGPGGELVLVEVGEHLWPEFFDLVRRESGLTIHVPVMPAGQVSLRLENCESWERVLDVVAESKGYVIQGEAPSTMILRLKK